MRSVCLMSFLLLVNLNISSAIASDGNQPKNSSCDTEAFKASVQKTGIRLKNMKQQYAAALKRQLRQLKKQKGWTDKEFLNNAAAYIQNDKVESYNIQNKNILLSIASLNKDNSKTTPDCQMLDDLNNYLDQVVKNTQQKWDYMFKEIKSASRSGIIK